MEKICDYSFEGNDFAFSFDRERKAIVKHMAGDDSKQFPPISIFDIALPDQMRTKTGRAIANFARAMRLKLKNEVNDGNT